MAHVLKRQTLELCSHAEGADVVVAQVLKRQTLERCSRAEEADGGALLTC